MIIKQILVALMAFLILVFSGCTPQQKKVTMTRDEANVIANTFSQFQHFQPFAKRIDVQNTQCLNNTGESLDKVCSEVYQFDLSFHAKQIAKVIVNHVYYYNTFEDCFETSENGFKACWLDWKDKLVEQLSETDHIVYEIGPWLNKKELLAISRAIPLPGDIESLPVSDEELALAVDTCRKAEEELIDKISEQDKIAIDHYCIDNVQVLKQPDPDSINAYQAEISPVIHRVLKQAEKRRREYFVFDELIISLALWEKEVVSWAGWQGLNLTSDIVEHNENDILEKIIELNKADKPDTLQILKVLEEYESAKRKWLEDAQIWGKALQQMLMTRASDFTIHLRKHSSLTDSIKEHSLALMSASIPVLALYRYRESEESCTYVEQLADDLSEELTEKIVNGCLLQRDISPNQWTRPSVSIKHYSQLNQQEVFGLVEELPIHVATENGENSKHWLVSTSVNLSIDFDREIQTNNQNPAAPKQVQHIDLGIIAHDIKAELRSSAIANINRDDKYSVMTDLPEKWRFWFNQDKGANWLRDLGLPEYVSTADLSINIDKNNGFELLGKLYLPAFSSNTQHGKSFKLAVSELSKSSVDKLVNSTFVESANRLTLEFKNCRDLEISCESLLPGLNAQIKSDFVVNDITVRSLAPFQVDLELTPLGNIVGDIEVTMGLDADGQWDIKRRKLMNSNSFVVGQLNSPSKALNQLKSDVQQSEYDLIDQLLQSSAEVDPVFTKKLIRSYRKNRQEVNGKISSKNIVDRVIKSPIKRLVFVQPIINETLGNMSKLVTHQWLDKNSYLYKTSRTFKVLPETSWEFTEFTQFTNWVDITKGQQAVAYQGIKEAFEKDQGQGIESYFKNRINTFVDEALTKGLVDAWNDVSMSACLNSLGQSCPLSAQALNMAVMQITSELSLEQEFDDKFCQTKIAPKGMHYAALLSCPESFALKSGAFFDVRAELLSSLTSTTKRVLNDRWATYINGIKGDWRDLQKQTLTQFMGIDFIAELEQQLNLTLSDLEQKAIKEIMSVNSVQLLLASKVNGVELSEAQIVEHFQHELQTNIQNIVYRSALKQGDLPPLFERYSQSYDSTDEIITKLFPLQSSQLKAKLSQFESTKTKFDSQLSRFISDNTLVDYALRKVNIKANKDQTMSIVAEVVPDLNQASARIVLPMSMNDENVIELLDKTGLASKVNMVKESSLLLKQAFEQKEQQISPFLENQLGDIYKDYLASCKSFTGNEELCKNPDKIWSHISSTSLNGTGLNGMSLSQWPIEYQRLLTDELKGYLDGVSSVNDVDVRERLLASGSIRLNELRTKHCVSQSTGAIYSAFTKTCDDFFIYIEQDLARIGRECRDLFTKPDDTPCFKNLHQYVINQFVNHLIEDDKKVAAAWQYAMSQTIALSSTLNGMNEFVLRRRVMCVQLENDFPVSFTPSEPGSCANGFTEFSGMADINKYRSTLKNKVNAAATKLEAQLKNQLAICVTPSAKNYGLPKVTQGDGNCGSPSYAVRNRDDVRKLLQIEEKSIIKRLNNEVDTVLSKVCLGELGGVLSVGADDECLSIDDLTNPQHIKDKVTQKIEQQVKEYVQQETQQLQQEAQALLVSYNVDLTFVDGQYCIEGGFFSSDVCVDDIKDLEQQVNALISEVENIDANALMNQLKNKGEEVILTAANEQLSRACDDFRQAMDRELLLFGSVLTFELDSKSCPPNQLAAKGKIELPLVGEVNVTTALILNKDRLSLDWASLTTEPSLPEILKTLMEKNVDGLEVVSTEIKNKGIEAELLYHPSGFPWPVEAIVTLGADELSTKLNLVDFDLIWQGALDVICQDIQIFITDEQLEILPDTFIVSFDKPYCVKHKLSAIALNIESDLSAPIGVIPLTVIVDSVTGIHVKTPDFKKLFVAKLADFLLSDDIGIKPAAPWFTTNDGLTLHLDIQVPVPILEMKAKVSISVSPKRLKFKGPIALYFNNWIDTQSISFGRFGVGFDPNKKIVELSGSASVVPGKTMSNIFRVDGRASFNLNDMEIIVTGSSVLARIIEVSKTTTRIHFKERLFEHSMGSGAMLAKVVSLKGLLRIQAKSPKPFVFVQGDGKLFGADIAELDVKLNRDLSGKFIAKLDVFGDKQNFDFIADKGFKNPRVGTSFEKTIGGESLSIGVSATLGTAVAEANVFGEKISIRADTLALLDLKELIKLINLKLSLKVNLSNDISLSPPQGFKEGKGDENIDGIQSSQGVKLEEVTENYSIVGWIKTHKQRITHDKRESCSRFGPFRFSCKTYYVKRVIKEIMPEVAKVTQLMGFNYEKLKDWDVEYRILDNSRYMQIKYYDKGASVKRIRIFENPKGNVKEVWTGRYGSSATSNFNCHLGGKKTAPDYPEFRVVHHLNKQGQSLILVKGDDKVKSQYKTLKAQSFVEEGECIDKPTSDLFVALDAKAKGAKKDMIALYDLFLTEIELSKIEHVGNDTSKSVEKNNLSIEKIGEPDTQLLKLTVNDDKVYWMHFDFDKNKYMFVQLHKANSRVKKQMDFLSFGERLQAIKLAFKTLCRGSEQKGFRQPCAITFFADGADGNENALLVLEKGQGNLGRKITLFPSRPLEGAWSLPVKWESYTDWSLFWKKEHERTLSSFFNGIKALSLSRLIYDETHNRTWSALYKNKDNFDTVRVATDQVLIKDSDKGDERWFMRDQTYPCIVKHLKDGLGLFTPQAHGKNRLMLSQYVNDISLPEEDWFKKGWKMNPLGIMQISCD